MQIGDTHTYTHAHLTQTHTHTHTHLTKVKVGAVSAGVPTYKKNEELCKLLHVQLMRNILSGSAN